MRFRRLVTALVAGVLLAFSQFGGLSPVTAQAAIPAATVMAAPAQPLVAAAASIVEYGPGPYNLWTQEYNTYDFGQCCGGDPSCYSNCYQWPYGPNGRGYFKGTWFWNFQSRSGAFYADFAQAIADASALPYNSPAFSEAPSSSCDGANVCVYPGHLGGGGICAKTGVGGTHATITINYDINWWDGPVPDGQTGCDIRAAAHHEMGHVLGLGHSSDPASVMYWTPTNEQYGTDEQHGLDVIYLNHNDQWTGGGGACPHCQSACEKARSMAGQQSSVARTDPCGKTNPTIPRVRYPDVKVVGIANRAVVVGKGTANAAQGLARHPALPHGGPPR